MRGHIAKRSIVVAGRKTTMTLEGAFWMSMEEIAALQNITVAKLIELIEKNGGQANLASAIRVFVLDHYQSTCAAKSDAG